MVTKVDHRQSKVLQIVMFEQHILTVNSGKEIVQYPNYIYTDIHSVRETTVVEKKLEL